MKTNEEIIEALKFKLLDHRLFPENKKEHGSQTILDFVQRALQQKDAEHDVEIWCDCGDLMEEDGRKDVWGDALHCLGCNKTVWIKLTQLKS